MGACPECGGIGYLMKMDEDLIIPDKNKTLYDGVKAFGASTMKKGDTMAKMYFESVGKHYGVDIKNKPIKKLPKEFMKKTQANAVSHAQSAIANEDEEAKERRRQQANQNRNPKCCFQKGGNPFAGKTPEQIAEINTRRKATWERTRKADEIRLNWGRERKTRFIFAKHPDPDKNQRLIKIRCYLRNRRKYNIQGRGGMLAIITSETQRSLKMEQQATKLGMIFRNE